VPCDGLLDLSEQAGGKATGTIVVSRAMLVVILGELFCKCVGRRVDGGPEQNRFAN
jgi:hypothetical protein